MLTNAQFTCLAERYTDMVFRVAWNYLGSVADAEDVTQNVFLKLLETRKPFASEEHIRCWLIRVALNECRNLVRTKWWRAESYEDCLANLTFEEPGHSDLFQAVKDLPKKYRIVIYLHHYEGYSTEEIAGILKIPKGTVCIRLKRGRELLKKALTEVDSNV